MEKVFKLYEVGGCVRDRFLGIDSKDIDFSFEFSREFINNSPHLSPLDFYTHMNFLLKENGFDIFLEVPEAFTTRARFPEGHLHEKLTADFVMCRKEVYLDPTSRMPTVQIGDLMDDLRRRDFTVNAMAIDENGNLIDPFYGVQSLKAKILKCPVDAKTSFNDDPLRMLRALRFAITKGFTLAMDVDHVIKTDIAMWEKFKVVVSQERTRDEVFKMFKHDSKESLLFLTDIAKESEINILENIFGDTLWLKPTFEKR